MRRAISLLKVAKCHHHHIRSSRAESEKVQQKLSQELQSKASLLNETEYKLVETRKKMHSVHRNSKKRLNRRERELNQGKKMIKDLQHKVSRTETQVSVMKAKLDRIRHRVAYWRACCYELLSLNVGVKNVKPVINAVLKGIAHKQVDRLPGRSVLRDINRWNNKIWETFFDI